jgi:hypothetical protein
MENLAFIVACRAADNARDASRIGAPRHNPLIGQEAYVAGKEKNVAERTVPCGRSK